MNYRSTPLAVLVLAILSIGLGSVLSAAPTNRSLLPTVYGQPVASVCDGTAPLLDRDTGSLAALYQAGHWYIAYQDRAQGGRGHLAEHLGGTLVEVAQPVASAPAFSPPDSVKVGSVALASDGTHGHWYYTMRKPGDTTGPYAIWCVAF